MTNTLSTRTTKVRNLAGAALAALITLMTLSLVAPSTAQAASQSAGVNPSTAAAGESVTVTGSGFLPGETVQVQYGGSTIASGVADANGDFSISGAIPAGMPEGGHPMDVVGSMGSIVSFSYTVAAPTPPTTPTPPAPASPSASPSTPSPSTPKASPTPGQDGTTDNSVDSSADRDGETELALGETAGTGDELGSSATVWGFVILVLAAIGLVICVVALRRSERNRI